MTLIWTLFVRWAKILNSTNLWFAAQILPQVGGGAQVLRRARHCNVSELISDNPGQVQFMNAEASYYKVSWFFEFWVRLAEYQTRKLEVTQSADLGSTRLIISPPTDAGLPILVQANKRGTTDLLCFFERLRRIAEDFCSRRHVHELATAVQSFFKIPVADQHYSVIYANCLFDFCRQEEIDLVLREAWRALAPKGVLFAVYMTHSGSWMGRVWEWLFKRFTSLSNGCHPISLSEQLGYNGFHILREA